MSPQHGAGVAPVDEQQRQKDERVAAGGDATRQARAQEVAQRQRQRDHEQRHHRGASEPARDARGDEGADDDERRQRHDGEAGGARDQPAAAAGRLARPERARRLGGVDERSERAHEQQPQERRQRADERDREAAHERELPLEGVVPHAASIARLVRRRRQRMLSPHAPRSNPPRNRAPPRRDARLLAVVADRAPGAALERARPRRRALARARHGRPRRPAPRRRPRAGDCRRRRRRPPQGRDDEDGAARRLSRGRAARDVARGAVGAAHARPAAALRARARPRRSRARRGGAGAGAYAGADAAVDGIGGPGASRRAARWYAGGDQGAAPGAGGDHRPRAAAGDAGEPPRLVDPSAGAAAPARRRSARPPRRGV